MEKCLRGVMIAYSIVLGLMGCGVIRIGVNILLIVLEYYPSLLSVDFLIRSYFLSGLGILIAATSIIGILLTLCCAKSKNVVRFFISLLVIILMIELCAIYANSIGNDDRQNTVKSNMKKNMKGYNNTMEEYTTINYSNVTEELNSTETSDAPNNAETANSIDWDSLQTNYQCCGITNKDDWINVANISPPNSCCPDQKCNEAGNNTYKIGCFGALTDPFTEFYSIINIIPNSENNLIIKNIITGLLLFIAVLQLLGIVFGLCFGCCFKSYDEYEYDSDDEK